MSMGAEGWLPLDNVQYGLVGMETSGTDSMAVMLGFEVWLGIRAETVWPEIDRD